MLRPVTPHPGGVETCVVNTSLRRINAVLTPFSPFQHVVLDLEWSQFCEFEAATAEAHRLPEKLSDITSDREPTFSGHLSQSTENTIKFSIF